MTKQRLTSEQIFIILVFLVILCLPFYIVRFSILSIPTTLLELAIYATFLYGLFTKKIKIDKGPVFYLALVFLASAFVAIFVDPQQLMRSAGLWKAYFFDGFLLFLMIRSLNPREKNKAFSFLVTTGAITALTTLALFFYGFGSADGRLLDLDGLSPNYLSMFLVPIFIASLFLTVSNYKDKRKFIYYLFCSLSIVSALLLTGSRAVYLSVPVGLLVLPLSFINNEKSRIRYRKFSIIAASLIVLAVLWLYRPVFGDLGRTGNSSNIRYYIWTTSLEIIKKNPVLGVGLSNFQDYFTQLTKDRVNYSAYIAPQALTAHNLYLHLYLTTGLAGLVSFLALIICGIRKSKNIVVVAMISSVLAYGLVDTPFFRNDLSGLFWVLLALL